MNPSKKKILENAFSLFLLENYDSVSMREIQEACKISRGAIYHHFKGKEDIYEQVVFTYLLPIFSSYSMIKEEERKTMQDTIYALIRARQNHGSALKEMVPITHKVSDFYLFKFIFQATELCKGFREQSKMLFEKEYNGWRNIVQSAMRTGEIRPDIDIDFVTQQFVIAPFGLGLTSAFNTYINTSVNDVGNIHLKLYNLLKKTSYYNS